MSQIRLPHNWQPRPYQMPLWHYLEGGGNRAICIWHRRSGKDDVCLHWAAVSAFRRPATYWHMLPEYAQGRKAIWTAVNPHTGKRRIDEAFPKELRDTTNEQEMFIRFKSGATWQVVGSDRYDAAVGSPPAGVTFSEWALANPAAWGYLAPILIENNGWSLFITTARGRNHAKSMLDMAKRTPGWFSSVLTINDTDAIKAESVELQRNEYHGIFGIEAGNALIEQEYFCSFEAAVLGAFYAREMREVEQEGRICKVDVDPDLPVHTAWDLGSSQHSDTMVIWCWQISPGRIHLVDYFTGHGHTMDYYAQWLDDRGYHGIDWFPRDAKILDVSGTADKTRLQTWMSMGRKPQMMPSHRVADGIQAVRKMLPICWFDEERCAPGIEGLREYKQEWDPEKRVFTVSPNHNWASHVADAMRTLAMSWTEPGIGKEEEERTPMHLIRQPIVATMTVDEFHRTRRAANRNWRV